MRKIIAQNIKAFFVALLLSAAGCVMVNELASINDLAIYQERPMRFQHVKHLAGTEADLSCVDCHTKVEDSDEAGMPKSRTCRNCHSDKEEIESNIKPFVVDKKIRWTNVTKLVEDVNFSHQLHVTDNEVECASCHQGIDKSVGVTSALRVEKDDCFDCHEHEYISADCSTCHESIGKEWKPPSHELSWERSHGQVVRSGIEPPYYNRCSLCHSESKCSGCHQDDQGKPLSHTNQWRHRGHGITARMDRTSCATCHRTDYCDRCHSETAPRSHRGSWGRPLVRHCYTCHFPLQYEGCNMCHKANVGHLSAPSPSNKLNHSPAWEGQCRTCHNNTALLKHPDKGDDCRSCHQ